MPDGQRILAWDAEVGATNVETHSRAVVGRVCSRQLSTNRRCDKLPRIQTIRPIEFDRKETQQMSRPSERALALLPL